MLAQARRVAPADDRGTKASQAEDVEARAKSAGLKRVRRYGKMVSKSRAARLRVFAQDLDSRGVSAQARPSASVPTTDRATYDRPTRRSDP